MAVYKRFMISGQNIRDQPCIISKFWIQPKLYFICLVWRLANVIFMVIYSPSLISYAAVGTTVHTKRPLAALWYRSAVCPTKRGIGVYNELRIWADLSNGWILWRLPTISPSSQLRTESCGVQSSTLVMSFQRAWPCAIFPTVSMLLNQKLLIIASLCLCL